MARKNRVLVLDDDLSVRRSLILFLEDCDFAVTSAESAQEALEWMGKEHHQLAVVDIRLPEMDGEAFIVHAHSLDPKTKFIIYTGSANYTVSFALEQIGVSSKNVFLKPLADLNTLLERMSELLSE